MFWLAQSPVPQRVAIKLRVYRASSPSLPGCGRHPVLSMGNSVGRAHIMWCSVRMGAQWRLLHPHRSGVLVARLVSAGHVFGVTSGAHDS